MKSWIEFEERFRRIADPLADLRLDWQSGSGVDYWRVCGMPITPLSQQFEALVELAGRTLEACAESNPDLQRLVTAEATPAERWFRALKELGGQFRLKPMYAMQKDKDGKESSVTLFGSVYHVVAASADLCLMLEGRYPMPKPPDSGTAGITITGTVGMLNTGEIHNVRSIEANATVLRGSGELEIAQALDKLTAAVSSASDLEEKTRSAILEQLEVLSHQATLPRENRAPLALLRASLAVIARALSSAGSVAQIWTTWGEAIKQFFCPG